MIAFSTCWNSHRHTDGEAMIQEIVDLGFDRIELGYGVSISLLPGITKAMDEGKFKVVGVHNFCPAPVEVMENTADPYEFTSNKAAVAGSRHQANPQNNRFCQTD